MTREPKIVIATCTLELHLPGCRSLKAKRSVIKRLKGRLTARFNVAVAEVGFQDNWQRSAIAVVSVSSSHTMLESVLEKVVDEVERTVDGVLLRYDSEFF